MTKRQIKQFNHTINSLVRHVYTHVASFAANAHRNKASEGITSLKNSRTIKIAGAGMGILAVAGLVVLSSFITKQLQHQHVITALTQEITISKPVTKRITPSTIYKTTQKGYTFAVNKESNTLRPVTFATSKGSISFTSYASTGLGDMNATTAEQEGNKTIYENIYNGVNLIYTNYPDRTLEEYEVKVRRPLTQIIQQIDTTNVTYKTEPDGSLEFFNKSTGQLAFAVPRPVMYEAQNTRERSYGLHFEVIQAQGKTYLVKVIDQKGQAWLQHASYPIMIDATVDLTLFSYESYPAQNNVWQVRLDTVGQGDLGIQTDSPNLQLESLTCGTQNVSLSNGTVSNFTCSDATIAIFKLLDSQQHNVTFTYSGLSTTIPSQPNTTKPTILSATANPPVVKIGDTITVSSHIIDPVGITSVIADMGGIETIQLTKNSGTTHDGTWQGEWKVHNTATKPYQITVIALNTNGQKEVSTIAFFDPYTCTGGGDHAGATWDPATDCPGGFAGTHTNISTLSIGAGETAAVSTFDQVSSFGIATISATTVTIAATGKIHADSKGWSAARGPGAGGSANGGAGGASYGGLGFTGNAAAASSVIYGSLTTPGDLGSGGGNANCSSTSGPGGGALKITATGTMTVNGTISSNGGAGTVNDGSGGTGGSIYLIAGTLTGNGTISANGGAGIAGGCGAGGSGGGGRAAINYSSANTFSGTFTAAGGTGGNGSGEAGTAIILDTTNNDLYINTNNTWRANPSLEGQSFTYHAVTVQNSATWTLKGYNTTNTDGVGQTFTTTNFTVATGATVTGTGWGYGLAAGPSHGTTINGGSGAGSYGGLGSAGSASAGGASTYGSAAAPLDLGSGAGSANCGISTGTGGGAIKILATGTLTVNGTLSENGASGGAGSDSGGGSGGSVYLIAATLAGNGAITANGGAGSADGCGTGGNGGGGRVAIYYATSTWAGTSTTAAAMAAAGTGGLGTAGNGTLTYTQKFLPVISSFNQFQSNCTTPVASGGSVTSTTACIGVTVTDGDNPDTETIDLEIEPNATPFTNTPTQTLSGVAMAGSPVSRTQTETVVLGQSYHWQARITDSLGLTTGWVAAGGNPDFLSQVQAPDSVTATYVSDTSITVNWTYSGAVIDGFDVERSTDGGAYAVINSNVAYPTTTFSDTTATANHEYIYRVRGFLGANNSAYTLSSNVDTTPAAPSNVTVTQPHVGTYTITWTDNANDESNFEIQRQIGSGSFVALSTTLAPNTTTYTDTQVQENQVYTYRVRTTRTSPNALQSTFGTAAGTTPSAAFGKGIYLTATGKLVLENDVVGSVDEFKNVQNDSTDKTGQDVSYDSTHPANGPVFPSSTTINDLTVKEGVSQVDGKSDVIYAATNNGLFAIHENSTTPASGGIKVYTKDYISELMIGDTRAMWPLDSGFGSGLSDVTSHTQTLTNNGSTTFTASGVRDQAASFNGTNQFLSISDNTNLSITGSLTVNAWFKTTSTSTAQTIVAKNGSYSLGLTASGTLQGQVIGATTATRTSTSVMDTGWHRATMVYDASAQTLALYIDGKTDTGSLTGTVPASITDSAGAFQIGANNGATLFSGNIDEVTINATALSAGQVANAYQDGYRALQNHTSGKITGITGTDVYQQLLGGGTGGATVNTVKSVRVDSGNQFIYVGTNDTVTNTGGVSVIGTISDSVLDLYSTINTSKVDSTGAAFAANDIVAIGIAGIPNPASNGQTDVSNTIGVLSFAGTNDTATRVWMESQRFSLAQVLGATTGGGGDSNQVTVNNLLTVGNVLSPTASTSGENILIPAFQVNQQGNILANYTGSDPTGTAYSYTDNVLTSGTTMSLTGSALTSGILFSLSANALTTGTGINATFNNLTSGTGLNVTSSANSFIGNLANISLTGTTNSTGSALNVSTAATGNGNKAIAISSTGATNGTNYGLYANLTGAATTNVAGYFSATGATNNYGLIVANGRVGFGTTTPTATLDVVGNASTSGNLIFRGATNLVSVLNGASLNFQTSVGGDTGLTSRFFINNNGNIGIGTTSPSNLFDINSLFDVTSAGKVGINTTTPLATLDVRGALGTIPIASLSGRTAFPGLLVDNSLGDLFTASSSGLSRFVISQNGNVGIGTTNPVGKLQLTGGGVIVNGAGETITASTSFTNPGGTLGALQAGYDTTNNKAVIRSVLWGTSFEPLYFQANEYRWSTGTGSQAEKMVLDVNGNLGIGTTNPGASVDLGTVQGTNKLYLLNSASNDYGLGANTVGGAGALQLYAGAGSVNNFIQFGRFDGASITEMARIQNSGLGLGTSTLLSTLDVRANSGTTSIASASGRTAFAGFVIDNSGTGDLLTASTSGTTRFVVNNQGFVGIGKTVPTTALDVAGGFNLTSYASISASLAVGSLSAPSGIGNAVFSGNVGIGTNSPTEKLSIAGGALSIYNSTTNRGDIFTTAALDKIWNTTALFNTAGATFSAGMRSPAIANQLALNPVLALAGWQYRKAVTVNNTTNANTLTNYQASISANTSILIAAGKMNADCSDIRITDADGSTLLNYWLEGGCNTTNTVIWTTVPSIPASSNKTIYMYYGNSTATSLSSSSSTFIRTITNVQASYRMDETSGSTVTDFSGNGNNGTATGTTIVNGQFNKARSFAGGTDNISTSYIQNAVTSYTVEAWVKTTALTATLIQDRGSTGQSLSLTIGPVVGGANGQAAFGVNGNNLFIGVYSSITVNDGNWHHLVGTWSGTSGQAVTTSQFHIYVDGVLKDGTTSTFGGATAPLTGQAGTQIGNGASTANTSMDEIRIYDKALSQAEITDEAANYGYTTTNSAHNEYVRKFSSPDPVTTLGAEESSFSSGAQSWTSDTMDAGVGNTFLPNFLTVTYALDGSDNIHPKFQLAASNNSDFSNEVFYPGATSYYQNGTSFPLTSGSQQDISTSIANRYRYWKVIAYMDTGATTTDTPIITSIRLQDYHGVSMLTSGFFGIGNTAPSARLDVQDSQSATVSAFIRNLNTSGTAGGIAVQLGATSPGTSNKFISFLDGLGEIIGSIQGNSSGGVTYATTGIDFAEYYKKASSSGELTPGTIVCTGPNGIITCSGANSILGVVSSKAGFAGGAEHAGDSNYALVGLLGQLPVRVASDSAMIPGDPISVGPNGLATKATTTGEIVGHVLSTPSDGGEGTIMVSVNPSWYDPNFYSNVTSGSLMTNFSTSHGFISTLETDNATISDTLTVLGRTTLTDVGVTGSITTGLLSIHGLDGQIQTLAGDLSLQHDRLGGVNILNGLVTIDTSGNITTQGVISAQSVNATQFIIKGSTTTGSSIIHQGFTSIEIDTPAMTTQDKVFVTPTTLIDVPLTVSTKANGKFIVRMATPQGQDVTFDWLIIKNKQ